jgi:hypothetical protein
MKVFHRFFVVAVAFLYLGLALHGPTQAGFAVLNAPIVYSFAPGVTMSTCTQSPALPAGNFDVCDFNGGVAYSTNGTTWTQVLPAPPSTAGIAGITYNGSAVPVSAAGIAAITGPTKATVTVPQASLSGTLQ